MKKSDTAHRLKEGMELRNLKQVDLVEMTKINKGALSSYLSGKYSPKQDNIYKLAMALNVSEAWLMGYDVPIERTTSQRKLSALEIPTKLIPVVGTVACGNPIYAEENIQEYITVNASDNVDFALYAEGDSMNNCKIDDGDTIFIRKQNIVDDGDIALVLVDDTATVKRFYDYPDKVILKPDSRNPRHKDLEYKKNEHNILIQGKVVFIKTFVH